ncbi:hypothetical protein PTKIN_Ptkin03bG0113000 [Pterospermum kingtungense]
MEHNGEISPDLSKERKEKKKERMRLVVEDDDDERGDKNQQADAFIRNFRNQLKIQREESFKRFQEMINRGI